MKLQHYILGASILAIGATVASCSDDITEQKRSEARIENYGFIVRGEDGTVYQTKFSEDGHTIYIKINPFVDASTALNNATPTFFLSMGATVTPPMSEPQNFADPDSPVEYTVTSGDGSHQDKFYVTYTVTDKIPVGEGYTHGDLIVYKNYGQMGYPGVFGSQVTWETHVTATYGDLLAFPAFCGKDKLVMFSRRYAWGDDGTSDPKCKMEPNHAYAFMVYDTETLTLNGTLNTGNIDLSQVVATASDFAGNMVAAVGRKAGGKTDFYYWTSPESAPVHMGTVNVSVDMSNHDTDGGPYISVSGDVTTKAVIAGAAPRTATGDHYKFQVSNGAVSSNYDIIHTGHDANDKGWFQMVSFYGAGKNDPYLVGDTEINLETTGTANDSGQPRVYLNNADGTNAATMDYHTTGVNLWRFDDNEEWAVRSGGWLERGGGRRPTVHAMVLNGKRYAYWTTGSDWRDRGILMTSDLTATIQEYPNFGWGLTVKETNLTGEGSSWLKYSFGMMVDWMWDDEEQEGYVAVWSERYGVHMFKLTCYE